LHAPAAHFSQVASPVDDLSSPASVRSDAWDVERGTALKRFASTAITFAAVGFLLGACANQWKTMAYYYDYKIMQGCTFGP
jgi:hypothetical protein